MALFFAFFSNATMGIQCLPKNINLICKELNLFNENYQPITKCYNSFKNHFNENILYKDKVCEILRLTVEWDTLTSNVLFIPSTKKYQSTFRL